MLFSFCECVTYALIPLLMISLTTTITRSWKLIFRKYSIQNIYPEVNKSQNHSEIQNDHQSAKVLLENGWNSKKMITEGEAAIPLETTLHAFRNQEKTKQRSTIIIPNNGAKPISYTLLQYIYIIVHYISSFIKNITTMNI